MNAIPLINIAPPRNDNVNKISNKLNNIPVSQNISGAVGMFGNSGFNNETQLRQEVNTSLVALKREAFNLETLINQAAKTLTDVNNRIAALENVQGDYVKKTDVTDTIESGNMNPVTSNAVATSNAMPVNSVTSGNMHSVTSNGVYNNLLSLLKTNNFRAFVTSGNGTQTKLKINYSGNDYYASIGFLIISRYSTEFVHIELDGQGMFFNLKSNVFVRRSNLNVTITNTDKQIVVQESTWNSWVILMFTASNNIFNDITFTPSE